MTQTPGGSLPGIFPFGQTGMLMRFAQSTSPAATQSVQTFARAVQDARLEGVTEVAPSLVSVLVRFDPGQVSRAALEKSLCAIADDRAKPGQGDQPVATRRWLVPASFGGENGPQLAEFAKLAGRTESQLIEDLTATDLHVLAIGFAPGQPYLGLLPESCAVPRQPQLTPQVPAGTIAAALRQLVLFVNDSPTGWRAVGRTAFRPFVIDRAAPFALRAGDAFRLQAVAPDVLDGLWAAPDGLGGAQCEDLS